MRLRGQLIPWFLISATLAQPPATRGDGPAGARDTQGPKVSRKGRPGDRLRIEASGERLKPCVVMIGHPTQGWATGVVISRQHRLVATAGHVADNREKAGELWVVTSSENHPASYLVDEVWYHPGILREFAKGLYVGLPDPAAGRLNHEVSPDLAVLRLTKAGPDLPGECELAAPGELADLVGTPVGKLGFPFDRNPEWPVRGRGPAIRLADGLITHLGDYPREEGEPSGVGRWFRCDIQGYPGESGGAVFLPNGHLVGVGFAGNPLDRPAAGLGTDAVRIDGLRELLAFHGLDAAVVGGGPAPRSGGWPPYPRPDRAKLRRAVGLLREASRLDASEDGRRALELCDEAIGLAPGYASAYLWRGMVRLIGLRTRWASLPDEESARMARRAIEDAEACFRYEPNHFQAVLIWLQANVLAGRAEPDEDRLRAAIACVDAWLGPETFIPIGDPQRSCAINCRAQARSGLGDLEGALRDYNESIRLAPDDPTWYGNRAHYWDRAERPDLAAKDREKAEELRSLRDRAREAGHDRSVGPSRAPTARRSLQRRIGSPTEPGPPDRRQGEQPPS